MSLLKFAAFLLIASTASAQGVVLMTTRTEGPPEPRLEVIALIEGNQLKNPTALKDKKAFMQKYLARDSKFFVIFGGGAAGTINLSEAGLGCNDLIYAIGPWNPGSLGTERIHGAVQGLATNSDRIARAEIWRRKPTAPERAAAVELAKGIVKRHGVAELQIAQIETVNLIAIDVDGDNRAELVGTFRVPQQNANATPRYLFLIAELANEPGADVTNLPDYKNADRPKPENGPESNVRPAANAGVVSSQGGADDISPYRTVFYNYQFFPNSDVYNSGEETLIDYADLDGDGTAEIVTNWYGVKDGGYRIYRRANGHWTSVYETSTPYCVSEGG